MNGPRGLRLSLFYDPGVSGVLPETPGLWSGRVCANVPTNASTAASRHFRRMTPEVPGSA
ncbi:MAG: hypothetical protein A3I63_02770 [Betaproteobacteria bacterium RIFCSPLOWO2_02_FULL_66_14]|nr:MAG: hypothetical protein A3I63_02770 [Betaproteobacteria bacterium RIFCSPLOWO2_02_FULL_66_14]